MFSNLKSNLMLSFLWWLLVLFATTTTVLAEQANITFSYNYTLFVKGGNDPLYGTIEQGLTKVDLDGLAFLQEQITEANVSVVVDTFQSVADGGCSEEVSASGQQDGFALCSAAICTVGVEAEADIDKDLIEKLSLGKVQKTFLVDFNAGLEGNVRVGYESPIFVKAIFNLVLGNANTPMDAEAEQVLLETALEKFKEKLADQGIVLESVRVVVQTPVIVETTRRQRQRRVLWNQQVNDVRELQQGVVTGNRVALILTGHCSGQKVCTGEFMQEQVDQKGQDLTDDNELLNDLKGQDDYFARVNALSSERGGNIVNVNVSDILAGLKIPPELDPDEDKRVEEESVPWWIYLLAGLTGLVLILGGVWIALAVIRRNEDALLRKAYDDHDDAVDNERQRLRLFARFGSKPRNQVSHDDEGDDQGSQQSPERPHSVEEAEIVVEDEPPVKG